MVFSVSMKGAGRALSSVSRCHPVPCSQAAWLRARAGVTHCHNLLSPLRVSPGRGAVASEKCHVSCEIWDVMWVWWDLLLQFMQLTLSLTWNKLRLEDRFTCLHESRSYLLNDELKGGHHSLYQHFYVDTVQVDDISNITLFSAIYEMQLWQRVMFLTQPKKLCTVVNVIFIMNTFPPRFWSSSIVKAL